MDFWEYNEHNIDEKGRLVLPASCREAFDGGGLLTYQGHCLALFEFARWDSHLRSLRDDPAFTNKELQFVKSFVTQFKPDAQNRVTVPSRLRERVGIVREVSLIGMGNHVAVYDRDTWKSFEADQDAAGDLADRLAGAL